MSLLPGVGWRAYRICHDRLRPLAGGLPRRRVGAPRLTSTLPGHVGARRRPERGNWMREDGAAGLAAAGRGVMLQPRRQTEGPQARKHLPSNCGQESRVDGYTPIVPGHLSACHHRRLDQPGPALVGGGSTPRSRRAARTSIHVRSPAPWSCALPASRRGCRSRRPDASQGRAAAGLGGRRARWCRLPSGKWRRYRSDAMKERRPRSFIASLLARPVSVSERTSGPQVERRLGDPHPRSADRSSSALARLRRCLPRRGKPVERVPPPPVAPIRLAVSAEYVVTPDLRHDRKGVHPAW
jgi:hypothetical protein